MEGLGTGGNTHQLEKSIPLETLSYVFIPIFSRSLQIQELMELFRVVDMLRGAKITKV